MNLAFAILTYNSQNTISRLLDSIYYLNINIYILDSGSTDNTLNIIENYPKIKLFSHEWKYDFSYSRNYLMNLIPESNIYFLDSDEWVESFNINYINTLIQKDYDVITCNNINIVNDRLILEDFRWRIINKNTIKFINKIHEEPALCYNKEFNIIKTRIEVLHDGYTNEVININKANRNLGL